MLERTGRVSNRDKTSQSSLCCRERRFCLSRDEREAAGLRWRLSTPPGVNQAIPPKLVSPERLIGLGLFRVLLIGSHRHRSFYLIGSGTATGRMKDWDLSAAPKSELMSDSAVTTLLRLLLRQNVRNPDSAFCHMYSTVLSVCMCGMQRVLC